MLIRVDFDLLFDFHNVPKLGTGKLPEPILHLSFILSFPEKEDDL
jgi:hypothetical protein